MVALTDPHPFIKEFFQITALQIRVCLFLLADGGIRCGPVIVPWIKDNVIGKFFNDIVKGIVHGLGVTARKVATPPNKKKKKKKKKNKKKKKINKK